MADPRITDPLWFDRPPEDLARTLLGCILATKIDGALAAGRIVEVEAYLIEGDAAAHSARGLSSATRTLFGPPGHLYVHPMRQRCGVDVVARGGSVLIRALEPASNIDLMCRRRGRASDRLLTSGPARLAEALGITRALDGTALFQPASPVWLAEPQERLLARDIKTSARIGLTRAADLSLRFYVPGSPYLSRREPSDQKKA